MVWDTKVVKGDPTAMFSVALTKGRGHDGS